MQFLSVPLNNTVVTNQQLHEPVIVLFNISYINNINQSSSAKCHQVQYVKPCLPVVVHSL